MHLSLRDHQRSPAAPAIRRYSGPPWISVAKAMRTLGQKQERFPAFADLPYELEQRLRAAERQELLRRLLRVLVRVASLFVLEGDDPPSS
jgi:hypothetical protein